MGRYHKVFDKSGTSSIAGTPILEKTYVCPESGLLQIIIAINSTGTLKMTFDDSTFKSLIPTLEPNDLHTYTIPVQINDQVNFQTAGNETIHIFHAILDSG